MRSALLLLILLIACKSTYSQTSDRFKIAENPLKKKSDPGYLANIFEHYIAALPKEQDKLLYQFDFRDGQYYFIKFDENCQVLKEGNVDFVDIDQKKTDTRIRSILNTKAGILIYFESHDKKDSCRAYLQNFDPDLKASGPRIVVAKRKEKYNSMTADTHFNYEAKLSEDESKVLIFHPNQRLGRWGNNEMVNNFFYTIDLKKGKCEKLKLSIFMVKGFICVLHCNIENNGLVGVVIQQGNDVKNNRSLLYRYKTLGNGADTNFVELPFQNIGLESPGFYVKDDIISIYSTYYIREPNQDPYKDGLIAGICIARVNCNTREVTANKYLENPLILSSYYDAKKKKITLDRHKLTIKSVIIGQNSTEIFLLPYVEETSSVVGNDLIYLKLNEKDEIVVNKKIESKFKIDNKVKYDMLFHVSKDKVYIITYEDAKNRIPQKKFVPLEKFDKAVLTVIAVDKNGEVKKTYDESVVVREKYRMDFSYPKIFFKESNRLFFYASRTSGHKLEGLLLSYKIPVD